MSALPEPGPARDRMVAEDTPEHLRTVIASLRESEDTVASLREALRRQRAIYAAQITALASLPDQIMAAPYQWTPGEDESSLIERAFETAAIIARRALGDAGKAGASGDPVAQNGRASEGPGALRAAPIRIPDDHPEATCEDCGLGNVSWSVVGDVWNAVCRPPDYVADPMLCPMCFMRRAAAHGLAPFGWFLVPYRPEFGPIQREAMFGPLPSAATAALLATGEGE